MWVFGINSLLLKPAYFQLYNLPIINVRRFFDYKLSKEETVNERSKYIKNYVRTIKQRKYGSTIELMKEKMKSPIGRYLKKQMNQKVSKVFYKYEDKVEYDRK